MDCGKYVGTNVLENHLGLPINQRFFYCLLVYSYYVNVTTYICIVYSQETEYKEHLKN